MKKNIIIVISTVIILGILSAGTIYFTTPSNESSGAQAKESPDKQDSLKMSDITKSKDEKEKDNAKNKELSDQTANTGGAENELKLGKNPSRTELLSTIHKMTHQKIVANEKWGAIPMLEENVDKVYEAVKANDMKERNELLEILEKWKKKDFNNIDEDHNFIWNLQGGTIGEALGKMAQDQEIRYIENNFGVEILNMWKLENSN